MCELPTEKAYEPYTHSVRPLRPLRFPPSLSPTFLTPTRPYYRRSCTTCKPACPHSKAQLALALQPESLSTVPCVSSLNLYAKNSPTPK